LKLLILLGPSLGRDPEHGQVGERVTGSNGVELDVCVGGQDGEVGGGPIGALEIAEDDQLAADGRFGLGEKLRSHVESGPRIEPFGMCLGPGQLLAEGGEVTGEAFKNRTRRCSRQNEVCSQTGAFRQVSHGRRPGTLEQTHAPLLCRHAVADVDQHQPGRVARLGHVFRSLLAQERPGHGARQQQHCQGTQTQKQQIAELVPGTALLHRFTDKADGR